MPKSMPQQMEALEKERDVPLAAANPSSAEVSPSVDGRWSTFTGQCSSQCQCPGTFNCRNCEMRNALDNGDAGTVARLRQFGRTRRSNVGQFFARCSDECPVPDRGSIQSRPTQQDPTRGCLRGSRRVSDTSDEEPLVRSVTGRHVVRRVGETEQSSEPCIMGLDSFGQASMQSTARHHARPRFLQSRSLFQTLRFFPVGQIRVLWLVIQSHLGRSGG